MKVANQAFEPLVEDVGVDLRGRYIGMAKKRLHDAKVRAMRQQMAGEGVPQHMG